MAREILMIEGRREGYAPNQIDATMTVGELIDWLENFDRDLPVMLNNDNGYTYGSITDDSFEVQEDEDDEEDDEEYDDDDDEEENDDDAET